MSRYVNLLAITTIGLLVVAGLGFAYEFQRIGAGNLVFLATLTLALGAIAAIFSRRMSRPDVSVEQMLYTTDHPSRS